VTRPADQDLGPERSLKLLPGRVQPAACLVSGQAQHQAEIHIVPTCEL
jgi:hypothetical protein